MQMKLGEVSLNTNDVVTLANFYKQLFNIVNQDNNPVHQVILSEGTQLTICNDGSRKNNCNQNISLAFTVDDIYAEYRRLLSLGVEIIQEPAKQSWGATNMSFCDPDRNIIYFRSFTETGND